MQRIHSLINGKAHPCDAGLIEKIYPATGEVIAQIEKADLALLDKAVEGAAKAQAEWAKWPALERSRLLHKIANALKEANEELSRLEMQDVGKLYS